MLTLQSPVKSRNYLFIGHPRSSFVQHLHAAISLSEQLSLTMRPDSKLLRTHFDYACYILDADYLSDAPALIRQIRRHHVSARVLVVTEHPHWESTREAFRAGAIDVIAAPTSALAMSYALESALSQALPNPCRV